MNRYKPEYVRLAFELGRLRALAYALKSAADQEAIGMVNDLAEQVDQASHEVWSLVQAVTPCHASQTDDEPITFN